MVLTMLLVMCQPKWDKIRAGGGTDLFVFNQNCGETNDLTSIILVAASNPTVHTYSRNPTSDLAPEREPDEPRTIEDVDGRASEFWKLQKRSQDSR